MKLPRMKTVSLSQDAPRARAPGGRWGLPRLLGCVLVILGVFAVSQAPPGVRAAGPKPVVLVFLQLDAKASVLERTLQAQLPDLTITVFGRFRDFEEGLATGHPDAVVSITPVLQQRGKTPTLQGERGGKGSEPYVLASVNHPLEGPLGGKNVGAVDLLGRDGTQAFLNALLDTDGVKVKRVAKFEDLLPLLEFSAADGVVLPISMLGQLTERTRLVIKTRDLTGREVGLSAVAVLNPEVREVVVRSFKSLDAATKHLLGIDAWSVP